MHLRYDEDFVEEAVLLCTTGRRKGVSSLHVSRFHREREKLYNILEPDERNTAFFQLHLQWFREWGLEQLLTQPLKEFPLLPKWLNILAFRKSRGKNDDGSELYVNETANRNGVVAMRPERFAHETELGAFLRHELTHLEDMVNPAFGYQPELPNTGPTLSSHRLARERYRLLWDVSIDGRLTRDGCHTVATKHQRWSEFAGAFAFWAEPRQRHVFESLWTNPNPTHQILAELVRDPGQLQANAGPRPGAPCPLCGFPTFAWAQPESLAQDIALAIQAEFAMWTAQQGACARCAVIYRQASMLSSHSSYSCHVPTR
jgi:hypothetical protein